MKYWTCLLATLLLSACANSIEVANSETEYLKAPGTEDMDLPFSSAVRVGDTLYLSGALGLVPGTRDLAAGGIQGETRQTLENISQTLQNFGSSMDRVVKCTVFLADMAEWGAMNEIYKTFFPNPPARSAVGASGIALNARVEIECIAVVN
jgi:2-iminobutanoate/2-iminopropanoate deaminase